MEILVKLRAYIITGLLLIISFVFTTVLVKTGKFSEFDKWLSSIIHNNRSSFLTNIMKGLDFIGSSYFAIGISLFILFYN